ncbi:hypothetical protein BDV93DRAFT_544812 [Ceratobasidium sp. AG-I]|nr:hypothetical protein BDV93DRAFT_544812 [Ceratobasidium sp. AG-I]
MVAYTTTSVSRPRIASCPPRLSGISQTTVPKTHDSMFCRPGVVHIHTERKFVKGLGYIRADATPRRSKLAVKEATYGDAYTTNMVLLQRYIASKVSGQASQAQAGALSSTVLPKTKRVSYVKRPKTTKRANKKSKSKTSRSRINSKSLGLYDTPRYPTAWTGRPGSIPRSLLPSFDEVRTFLASPVETTHAMGAKQVQGVRIMVRNSDVIRVTMSLKRYYFG